LRGIGLNARQAERSLRLGSVRKGLSLSPFSLALTAFGLVPVAMAFFATTALIMLGALNPIRTSANTLVMGPVG
jgi:hypothetical protein